MAHQLLRFVLIWYRFELMRYKKAPMRFVLQKPPGKMAAITEGLLKSAQNFAPIHFAVQSVVQSFMQCVVQKMAAMQIKMQFVS